MDCQRCGGAGHTDAECSAPETALMDFLREQGHPAQEWKPTAEKRLDLASLSLPSPGVGAPPPARTATATPSWTASPAPVTAAGPAPVRLAGPVVREWIEPPVLVALGVALSALLVLVAVGWLFL